VSVSPPMKKMKTYSKGVICLPGRRPAERTIKTKKQYPKTALIAAGTSVVPGSRR
jgi:hypothetical protein